MKIGILVPLHNLTPERQKLFGYTMHCLLQTKLPIWMFADNEADAEVARKYLLNEQCQVYSNYPNTEWEKVREAYARMRPSFDAIAICHDDDLWLKDKIAHQAKYISNHILVMTAFVYYVSDWKDENHAAMQRKYPELGIPAVDREIGIWNCMPSIWMINTHKCEQIPIIFDETACHDSAVVNELSTKGSIGVIRQPYVLYRDSLANQWHTDVISEERRKRGRELVATQVRRIPKPKLIYYWE